MNIEVTGSFRVGLPFHTRCVEMDLMEELIYSNFFLLEPRTMTVRSLKVMTKLGIGLPGLVIYDATLTSQRLTTIGLKFI